MFRSKQQGSPDANFYSELLVIPKVEVSIMAAEIFNTAHINTIFRLSKIKTTLNRVKSQVIFTPKQMERGRMHHKARCVACVNRCFQTHHKRLKIFQLLCTTDVSHLKQLIQSEGNWSFSGGPEAQKPFRGYDSPFTFSMKGQLQVSPAGF